MLQTIIDNWFQYCLRYYTSRTCGHYRMVLHSFNNFLAQDGKKLSTEAIEKYIDSILQDRKVATANRHLVPIKSFCRWRAEHYHINNPASKVKLLKEETPQQRVLSDKEYEKVLATVKGIDKAIIQFLANTGLRKTEFRKLTDENIGVGFIHLEGKGRKTRLIPLNNICKNILVKYKSIKPLIGKYPGREGLYWCCKKAARQAEIKKFGPHSLRHFFATRLMRADVPLIKISKLLGHSSIRTTERIYIHWIPDDLLARLLPFYIITLPDSGSPAASSLIWAIVF